MNVLLCFSVVFSVCVITKTQESSTEGASTTDDGPSDSAETFAESCEIENITIIQKELDIFAEWSPPDITCIEDYIIQIYLNDEPYENTTGTNITIKNVDACITYDVAFELFSGEQLIGERVTKNITIELHSPSSFSVQDLAVNKTSTDDILVTWNAPTDSVAKCVTKYQLGVWDDDNINKLNESLDAAERNFTFTPAPLIGCMKYVFEVKPVFDEVYGHAEQRNLTSAPQLPHEPELLTNTTGKVDIVTIWKTDFKDVNRCLLKQIIVTCQATEDANSDYDWIERDREAVVNVSPENPSDLYNVTLSNLSPFTNYTCFCLVTNEAGNSTETQFDVTTEEDVPSKPESINITPGARNFKIQWEEPSKIPTILEGYTLQIKSKDSAYIFNKACYKNASTSYHYPDITSFVYENAEPYYNYEVILYAQGRSGNGSEVTANVTTLSSEPDPVQNPSIANYNYSQTEDYEANATITFDAPCNTYGVFEYYKICWSGERTGFDEDDNCKSTSETTVTVPLQAERNYKVTVSVVTENFNSTVSLAEFVSESGVPSLNGNLTPPTSNDPTKSLFTFSKQLFDNTYGEILYYALILLPRMESPETTFGFWDGNSSTWPPSNVANKPVEPRSLTDIFWNPFTNGTDTIDFEITNLSDDTEYSLIVRALTRSAYKDSPLNFKTELLHQMDLGLILGLTFGLLLALILVIFIIFLWRRKRKTTIEEVQRISTSTAEAIPCEKFVSFCQNIEENSALLKAQYTLLNNQSKEIALPISYATLPENKRKNRYTNILPYDETRVKLKIDEDDEIGSDYINASYIKGYSGNIEYIATQGPLESTAKDFWKMIVQENVTIIAMVSQFVEQSKEKCFQYFPNNHEQIQFGESVEVKCCTELHFGTYCIRTLQVRKDAQQRNVTHMQFLEWPDFGVPQGIDDMLQFCNQLREKAVLEGGIKVVHCSAGVGRTGTLIVLDVLLQAIRDGKDINIYNIVLDLRKQRTNMVQTERQYMFIHSCLKEYLQMEQPKPYEHIQDNLYENIAAIRSSMKENLIETELESAF